jgi:indole-3-glycerol phosphate synthase/phosphoribosylanthranilate isomerase
MRAKRPAEAARALVFGRVKLCGLNQAGDFATAAPATFAGFVFVPGSIRDVDAERVHPLARLARRRGMLPVGVFRDAPISSVADISKLLNLHAVQLHGREDGDYVGALKRQLPDGCELWTAVSVGRGPLERRAGDRLVFDNGTGGTGKTFDWTRIGAHPRLVQSIVAGGIGPHNAREAQRLGAYAIDVGSALDEVPGCKSPDKMRALFDALRPGGRKEVRACA